MDYSQTSSTIRLIRGSDNLISDFTRESAQALRSKKIYVAPTSERLCVIRTSDGVETEHRGCDVPSVAAVLLFFKKRKLRALQERNGKPEDRRQRMARDLRDRLAGRSRRGSEQLSPSLSAAPSPWWEKIGMLQKM
ncbi:hypothetical protein [Tardiphaga sp.]|uniref:hypothetical protein n=1 Tax=Tardiphaga sp. TaxID=1926292 RepID=UPI00260C385D|nr:hypothetical protein [Tardiphaga sp.]